MGLLTLREEIDVLAKRIATEIWPQMEKQLTERKWPQLPSQDFESKLKILETQELWDGKSYGGWLPKQDRMGFIFVEDPFGFLAGGLEDSVFTNLLYTFGARIPDNERRNLAFFYIHMEILEKAMAMDQKLENFVRAIAGATLKIWPSEPPGNNKWFNKNARDHLLKTFR